MPNILYLQYIQPQIIYHEFYNKHSILTYQYSSKTLWRNLYHCFQNMKQTTQYLMKRYALTFGENSIPDVSECLEAETAKFGFSVPHLHQIAGKLSEKYSCTKPRIYTLSSILPQQVQIQNQAAVLHLPQFTNIFLNRDNGADLLYEEQQSIEYDQKYYNIQKKQTMEKFGKYNMVFRDYGRHHDQTYKEFTITSFRSCQYLNQLKLAICKNFSGENISKLLLRQLHCEGNQYFESDSGIGYHGDKGRKIVIGVSLGYSSILRYCWKRPYDDGLGYLPPIDIELKHGDIYVMSEKATGQDYLNQQVYRLVHAAGSSKYINIS